VQQQSRTRADAVGQAPELASRSSLTTTRVARILALVTDPWAGSGQPGVEQRDPLGAFELKGLVELLLSVDRP